MTLRDIVFNHPEILGLTCIAWCAVAIWVVSLVGWMIQGEVELAFGVVGIAVAFVLAFWVMQPPLPYLRFVSFAAVVGMVVIYPSLRQALNQRQLASIDIESMMNAYHLLKQKPDNAMAKFKLARVLYDRGQVEPALSLGAAIIKDMPEKLFPDENRLFGRWKRNHRQVNVDRPILCLDCGTANSGGDIYCRGCGRDYLIDIARGRWVGRDYARKLLAGWIAAIAAIGGMPFAATLPAAFAIPIIVALLVGALVLLFIAFKAGGPRKR